MKKIITLLALFVVVISSAQTQFEQGMGKAFGLWKEGKNTEASAMFECGIRSRYRRGPNP